MGFGDWDMDTWAGGGKHLPTTSTKKKSIEHSGQLVIIPGGKENQGRQVLMLGLRCHHHVEHQG